VEAFSRHRYLVGPPWQYAVLLQCIADERVPENTTVFLDIAASAQPALAFFTEAYFAQRARLAQEPRWFDLVTPFGPATAAFSQLLARGVAAILSTRDDASIAALCRYHLGIEDVHPHLLPRAGSREKWQVLLEAADLRRIAPSSVFFVDDYLQHALPARGRGIAAQLATWGYLGPNDESEARAAGLPCLALADLAGALLSHEETTT
jgi:hypothetical protein